MITYIKEKLDLLQTTIDTRIHCMFPQSEQVPLFRKNAPGTPTKQGPSFRIVASGVFGLAAFGLLIALVAQVVHLQATVTSNGDQMSDTLAMIQNLQTLPSSSTRVAMNPGSRGLSYSEAIQLGGDETGDGPWYPDVSFNEYNLVNNYQTRDDILDDSKWACYMGRTAYSAYTPAIYTGMDWYQTSFFDISSLGIDNIHPAWLNDPTNGVQSYELGCANKHRLVTDRPGGKPGFMIKAAKTNKNPQFKDPTGAKYENGYPGSLATLRLEEMHVVPTESNTSRMSAIKVFNVPTTCGSWPAFWSVTAPPGFFDNGELGPAGYSTTWPRGGEIDMIEQVNGLSNNHVTLHTGPGCQVDMSTSTGGIVATVSDPGNCNNNDGKDGCSTQQPDGTGGATQSETGAIYLCEWNVQKHVFCMTINDPTAVEAVDTILENANFTREELMNASVANGTNPAWTKHELSEGCNSTTTFTHQHLVINTAVCGQWAGSVECNHNGINYPNAPPPDANGWVDTTKCNAAVMNAIQDADPFDTEATHLKDMQWEIGYIKTFSSS